LPVVERIRSKVERERASLARILAASQVLETPGAIIASERTARTEYTAFVTSRNQSPIEAFGYTVVQGDRVVSRHITDYCLSNPLQPHGRIAPGESREVHVGMRVDPRSELPTLRLSFVLYDDLMFEGSREERDDILRSREQQADDLAFVNNLRRELSSVPDDQLQEFLAAKRTERTRTLLASGRRPEQPLLDVFMADAKRAPSHVRDTALLVIPSVDEQVQRLLRHRR
jgi:hypothetical protein